MAMAGRPKLDQIGVPQLFLYSYTCVETYILFIYIHYVLIN